MDKAIFMICAKHPTFMKSTPDESTINISKINREHIRNTKYSFALSVWSRKDLKQARLWPRMTCKFFFPILIDFKLSVMPLQNNMVCFCDSPIIVFFHESSPVVPRQRFGDLRFH